jgi:DNA-binding response OmpR family regulator
MTRYNILWADDEIEMLKPHIIFLNSKGYDVTPVNSGIEAVEKFSESNFDLVFLDENMPGMSGLEALNQIKLQNPSTPVVMITKNEEEHIMEEAIGSKIADYLIKPINPSQILLSLKKLLENKKLITEKTNQSYQQDFRNLSMQFNDRLNHNEWVDIYKKLVFWELEINNTENKSMKEVIDSQKNEANHNFCKFIIQHYESWLNNPNIERPILSHQVMKKKTFPLLDALEPVFFLLIDNLRYDQWRTIQPLLSEYWQVEEDTNYYAILPTTTAYARNAIFAGMMPAEIEKKYPHYWVDEETEEGKNNFEHELLKTQLQRNKLEIKSSYHKILNVSQGKALLDALPNLLSNKLNVIVYNFVDMLSHARTDMAMIRELAADESAYRSITHSWFLHSPLFELLKKLSEKNVKLVITTDHGTIRVQKPFKVVGDKSTNTNLRYKVGKNLSLENEKDVYLVRKPELLQLPKPNVSSSYVFTKNDSFFAYPNNYNYYVNYYKDTFQHGGISMEEVIVPYVYLKPKQAR